MTPNFSISLNPRDSRKLKRFMVSNPGPLRKRLLVMDDDLEIAEQIRVMLAPQHDVVAITDDLPACLAVAKEHQPEVALLDISMPRASGFMVAGLLLQLLPAAKIIFVTQHSSPAYINAAREAGASGYVLKHKISEDLEPALEEVLNGGEYISPSLRTRISPPPRLC